MRASIEPSRLERQAKTPAFQAASRTPCARSLKNCFQGRRAAAPFPKVPVKRLGSRSLRPHGEREGQMHAKRNRFIGTLVCVLLLVPMTLPAATPAMAVDVPDQVLAWNQHAYEEFLLVQPAPVALFHVAMVH